MAYTKRIVCLVSSLKHGGLCIAGRELTPQGLAGWVRPISTRPTAELTYLEYRYPDGSSPKPLDILDVPLLAPAPHHHQTENHLIDSTQRWTKQRELPHAKLKLLIEDPPTLWSNHDQTSHGLFDCVTSEDTRQANASLYLLHLDSFTLELCPILQNRRSYRGLFEHRGVHHNFSVTDPAARDHLDAGKATRIPFQPASSLYLCVSLTEPYPGDHRCHKLIAAILTDPPL